MKHAKLTASQGNATNVLMHRKWHWRRTRFLAGALLVPVTMLAGCINVTAPDKPIVIELNINIRQEVIYMLAEDAAETIQENAEIF